jgi:hypothetical protein
MEGSKGWVRPLPWELPAISGMPSQAAWYDSLYRGTICLSHGPHFRSLEGGHLVCCIMQFSQRTGG